MLKKAKKLMLALLVVSIVAGCSGGSKTESTDYQKLSQLINSPASSTDFEQGSDITFTAVIIEEPFDSEIDGETKKYITAMIARNALNFVYIDVTDIDFNLSAGDIATITGTIDGYLYWTYEGMEQEVLNLVGKTIEKSDDNKDVKIASGKYKDEELEMTIEFDKAVKDMNSFDKEITYIYYDFINENKSMHTNGALNNYFYVYQGDQLLIHTIFDGSLEQPSNALKSTLVDAGKEVYMYQAYELYSNDDLTIVKYDDDFNVVYEQTLTIE